MASGRTLYSGNLVRGFHVGDRKLFMEKYYDPEKYMELGTFYGFCQGVVSSKIG